METSQEKLTVVDPDEMSAAVFAKHMNKRHRDSLGGLRQLWESDSKVMSAWRDFHHQLHSLRTDLNHDHSGPVG